MSLPSFPRLVHMVVLSLAMLLPAADLLGQRESVRPGINKSFEDPDVDQFVDRFEREGRDAYDHRDEIVAACQLKPGMAIADIGTISTKTHTNTPNNFFMIRLLLCKYLLQIFRTLSVIAIGSRQPTVSKNSNVDTKMRGGHYLHSPKIVEYGEE